MHIKLPYLICIFFFVIIAFYLLYPKIENFFIFFPDKTIEVTPDEFEMLYKEVFFYTEDGIKLNGWFFQSKGKDPGPVILFFHGNAGNISHRLDNVQRLLLRKLQVFIFDYRGYGKSSGKPSEKGLYLDGLAAYDYLITTEHISPDDIILFGRSLGAAIAIDTALKRDVRSVIMESAFLSTKSMANTMLLFRLFSCFLPPNYNNLEKVKKVDSPKLFIHGDKDEIVPFSMGEQLYREARSPKYFLRLEDSGHNDTYIVGGENYFNSLVTFAINSKL
ncbi:alpha/beta hydrolase [Thermodesulfobacteriota bacterium]